MRTWPRNLILPALGLLLYLGLHLAFARLSGAEGLLNPDGAPDLGVAALGLLFLLVRVWALLILPALLVSRLLVRLLVREG